MRIDLIDANNTYRLFFTVRIDQIHRRAEEHLIRVGLQQRVNDLRQIEPLG